MFTFILYEDTKLGAVDLEEFGEGVCEYNQNISYEILNELI